LSLCVTAGAASLVLATQAFTLAWTHSVEKTEWREHWAVTADGLALTEAWIKGSGAGMEPPPDAARRDGWYVYRPAVAPLATLRLAVSGATGDDWRLCTDGDCGVLDALLSQAAPDGSRSGGDDRQPVGEIVLFACDGSVAGRMDPEGPDPRQAQQAGG
jgi:hypothetical protein